MRRSEKMKRFITYLFEYENGKKGKNVGFIRVDIRNAVCRMEIRLHNLYRYQGKGQIYLLVNPEKLTGLSIGNIVVSQGRGEAGYTFSVDGIAGSDYPFSEVIGVGIRFGDRYYAASSWTDVDGEKIGAGKFAIWQKERETEELPEKPTNTNLDTEQQEVRRESPTTVESESAAEEEFFTTVPESTTKKESATHEGAERTMKEESRDETFDVETASASAENSYITQQETRKSPAAVRVERIDINGIRQLPKKNYHLCNNSFLIHGYLNYHHLMRKEIKENGDVQLYLGVPGVYERQERMMALLFGFPKFETEREFYGANDGMQALGDRAPGAANRADPGDTVPSASMDGTFGYWVCGLER
jgi:hypothetical protein